MNQQATLDQLLTLRLPGMARHYEAVLQLPAHQHPDAHSLVATMADAENQHRRQARLQLNLRMSKLRYTATIEQVSYASGRNFSRDHIVPLLDCSWVDRAENILIAGPTGCGKSFLACALGHQACIMGFRTLYLNLNRFIDKIAMAKLDGSLPRLLTHLEKMQVIILDDFGLAPIDQNTRLALLQMLEDRYARKSVVIASQIPVAHWHDYIAEPTLADAILDRLTANAHRFDLKGESMRQKLPTKPM